MDQDSNIADSVKARASKARRAGLQSNARKSDAAHVNGRRAAPHANGKSRNGAKKISAAPAAALAAWEPG